MFQFGNLGVGSLDVLHDGVFLVAVSVDDNHDFIGVGVGNGGGKLVAQLRVKVFGVVADVVELKQKLDRLESHREALIDQARYRGLSEERIAEVAHATNEPQ